MDSMKDYMRAAGQYAARIASLTQEIQELVGDVLPYYRKRRKTPPFRAGDIRRVRRICVSN